MNEQKKQNQQAGLKLPQIQSNNNRLQSEQKQAQQQHSNTDNLQPLTHQKKKKKFHKRKVRKHSPEYYQKIKKIKLNKLKQKNWDSHFINDVIPQMINKNKNKPKRTLSRLDDKRQSIDVINPISNKTLNNPTKKEEGFSQADKTNDKNKKAKSFNIRVVNNQTQSTNHNGQQNKIKKQAQIIQKVKPNAKTQKNKFKNKQIIKLQDDQSMIKQINKYQDKINVLFEETKFINCHKQVLESFLAGLNKKNCYEIIDKQLVKLKGKHSQIFKIIQSIEKRQNELEKVKNQVKQKNDISKIPYEVVDNFRISTLACIEEILKWKQKWQNNYLEIFQRQISFDLVYKVQNYLLTILKSADELLLNNSSLQNNTQAVGQQKKQKNKNVKIKSKDPFLISIFGLEKESKQIVLKIRACQLLLLEEQYNSKKK